MFSESYITSNYLISDIRPGLKIFLTELATFFVPDAAPARSVICLLHYPIPAYLHLLLICQVARVMQDTLEMELVV